MKEEIEIDMGDENIRIDKMYIGNENGWVATVDFNEPCEGKDCISVKITEDGTMQIKL